MALDCLLVPLISDNPKRLFSSGRDIINYRRLQLYSDIIEACAFLRSAYGPLIKTTRAGVTTLAFNDDEDIKKSIDGQTTSSFISDITAGFTTFCTA